MKHHNYYVYLVTNPKKKVLYTGVTNNLFRRVEEHYEDAMNQQQTFAGKYFCFNLVYYEWYASVEQTIAREKQIKA